MCLLVMSMGFTNTQARLALRCSGGNVDAAVENIIKVNNLVIEF